MIKEIDGNTAKLKSKEPKFYSITVSPSKYELKRLQNNSTDLKKYTRELMKEYVKLLILWSLEVTHLENLSMKWVNI